MRSHRLKTALNRVLQGVYICLKIDALKSKKTALNRVCSCRSLQPFPYKSEYTILCSIQCSSSRYETRGALVISVKRSNQMLVFFTSFNRYSSLVIISHHQSSLLIISHRYSSLVIIQLSSVIS